jgi:pyrimidine-specific ribonucleoside hydrolase
MRRIAAAVFLVLAACTTDSSRDSRSPEGPVTTPPRELAPIVVDTDAGLDDAIALLYLATSPNVDLRAVTVSGTGLAHCFPGARNVIGLLELAGRGDVPVSCGPESPLGATAEFHPFPDGWRRFTDSRYGDAWRIGRGSVDDRPAPELLAQTVAASDTPVDVVALGPLTNVAAALDLDTAFGSGIRRVIVMGGAFDVPGNTANAEPPAVNVAEWNMYADPSAAGTVVRSELPIRFVPLDATNSVPVDLYVLRALALAPPTEATAAVGALLAGLRGMIAAGDYYLWDPLAAVLSVHPELGTLEQRTVDVVTTGPEAGRTISSPLSAGGTAVELFSDANGRLAEGLLLAGLSGAPEGEAVTPVDERPDLSIDFATCTAAGDPLTAGPRILQLASPPASGAFGAAAIGTLAAGRDDADIEAYLAAPTPEVPGWFTLAAMLGGSPDAPTTDLVRLPAGTYTVVCVDGAPDALRLAGTARFRVDGS